MEVDNRGTGGAGDGVPSPFLTLLSFNTAKRPDLAGASALLRENKPHIVFLQEVGPNAPLLNIAAAAGYRAWFSTAPGVRRTFATLSRVPDTQVRDVQPGFSQLVTVGPLQFLHLHLPSGTSRAACRDREAALAALRPEILPAAVPPVLIGDFNCVVAAVDTEDPQYVRNNKSSPTLIRLLQEFQYVDAFRVLHPATARFSHFQRGQMAARLDRCYLPQLLSTRPRQARYIPSTSDHHAFLLRLEASGLGALQVDPALPRPASYWKLNSALLHEPSFLLSFHAAWEPVLASKPPPGPGSAGWWEETAKPAIVAFCKTFSKQRAKARFELRRFLTLSLERALDRRDWTEIAACKRRIQELDDWRAAGIAMRAHVPLADGEQVGIFHLAAEGRQGPSSGLTSIKTADGRTLTEPDEVQAEVMAFFEAIFQGRHAPAQGAGEPVDSGQTFSPDARLFPQFLDGLPSLLPEDRDHLERPFSLEELEDAVDTGVANKSPGLDGLSYELYKRVLPLVGQPLLEALNAMLAAGLLQPSLRKGVVRLLPKVAGVPTASQLRPITLLVVDYKLLTKMFVSRLLPLLPRVLSATQLCSVQGRSIFSGAASILSAIEHLHRNGLPGFLLSLDFFHAYDRVSLEWVDRVLEAMGFGATFRGWVATLHRDTSASFLLSSVSPALPLIFSIRQGDPISSLLFVISIEPFLLCLEASLRGLYVGMVREASLGYMDDVATLGTDVEDILRVDAICRDFEAASGAILNRNRKTVILGLGSWRDKEDWPLPWIQVVQVAKVYGVSFTADSGGTVQASWDRVLTGIEGVLRQWTARHLPTLLQRSQVLEVFALSKAWYMAQILPLPASFVGRLKRAAGGFLWRGHLERLAYDELHRPLSQGGLHLSCPASRAEALLGKQTLHLIANGGRAAGHLAYWLGQRVRDLWPALGPGPHPEVLPPSMASLATLVRELTSLDCVDPANPRASESKKIYKELTATLPPPKVELRQPGIDWRSSWVRLAKPGLPFLAVDVAFRALHNVLPLQTRLHRLLPLQHQPACLTCGLVETPLHFFTACPRTGPAWEDLASRVATLQGGPVADIDLLFLAWPRRGGEDLDLAITLAVVLFIEMAWESREDPASVLPAAFRGRVNDTAGASRFRSVFV